MNKIKQSFIYVAIALTAGAISIAHADSSKRMMYYGNKVNDLMDKEFDSLGKDCKLRQTDKAKLNKLFNQYQSLEYMEQLCDQFAVEGNMKHSSPDLSFDMYACSLMVKSVSEEKTEKAIDRLEACKK